MCISTGTQLPKAIVLSNTCSILNKGKGKKITKRTIRVYVRLEFQYVSALPPRATVTMPLHKLLLLPNNQLILLLLDWDGLNVPDGLRVFVNSPIRAKEAHLRNTHD